MIPNPRTQIEKILTLMHDGEYRTLSEISIIIYAPEASVSANLRHLRKPKFGGYIIIKRYRGSRWEYRLTER